MIEVDGRAEHVLLEEVIHVICKVRLNYNGSVILAGVQIVDCLVGIIKEHKADLLVLLKLFNKLVADVYYLAVLVHIVTVITDNGNADISGLAIGIPEGINIEPSIKSGQKQYRQNNKEGEEVPRQCSEVVFENSKYITHTG